MDSSKMKLYGKILKKSNIALIGLMGSGKSIIGKKLAKKLDFNYIDTDSTIQKETSVLFGNFEEAYQIVDRQGLHVMRDPYSYKPYVEFYITRRLGGDVVNFKALKGLCFKA